MKKTILIPLAILGSVGTAATGGYFIYASTNSDQNTTGINVSTQNAGQKELNSQNNQSEQDQNFQQQNESNSEQNENKTGQDQELNNNNSESKNDQGKQESNEPDSRLAQTKNDPGHVQSNVGSTQFQKNTRNNDKKSIRVGFWNVLNYTHKSNSGINSAKTYAIANIINSSGVDAIGLAEITVNGNGDEIVKELEKLNSSAGWKHLTTEKVGKQNQQEKYSFLYKSSLLETVDFESKSNPYLIQEGTKINWSRPVAAAKFKTKTNINNDFTLVIGHFDSPGKYSGKSTIRHEESDKDAPGQGSQEAGEARDLINVLNNIDQKDGVNDEIIFMGDTNIRGENTKKLFEETLKSYKSLLNNNENTTLSSTFGQYANAYDKIFYKGDLQAKNAKKLDIFSIFSKKTVDQAKFEKLLENDNSSRRSKKSKRSRQSYQSSTPKDISLIKKISDHTMVYFDLELSSADTD